MSKEPIPWFTEIVEGVAGEALAYPGVAIAVQTDKGAVEQLDCIVLCRTPRDADIAFKRLNGNPDAVVDPALLYPAVVMSRRRLVLKGEDL